MRQYDHQHSQQQPCHCHDHTYSEDCSCHSQSDHHHHHGEDVVDNALVLSRTGLMAGGEMGLEEALRRGREALLALADAVEVEGIVPGHVKALLSCGNVSCTLSVTRAGVCDILLPQEKTARGLWTATVNLISVIRPQEDPTPLLALLFT